MKYLLILCLFVGQGAWAFNYADSLYKKYENKQQKRWTLADYLAQKQKFGMMDSWLAANMASNFFEMYLGGSQFSYDKTADGTTTANQTAANLEAALFFSIVGFHYEKLASADENNEITSAHVSLRLLGVAEQATHLTVYYGQRNYKNLLTSYTEENPYWGSNLTLYLFPVFGIEAEYRSVMESKNSDNVNVSGVKTSYGAFVDLFILRLYGKSYTEAFEQASGSPLKTDRVGTEVGVKLFF